ncbi:snoaL-like polyketide cyclase family protein [Bordetella holmesii 30539]|uniref:nuclear transport factor 2 family protein n=1 Tax=Bordetella holmesii TaxID=35814 RepID=UPI00044D99A6|nr:nuclear transport factor 2 family protein [Bordetella holmesii]EXF89802.1 snoaL-like polyketide cyclase family protein [Bordetella holmesii 30539]
MSDTSGQTVNRFLNALHAKDVPVALEQVSENAQITVFPMQIRKGPKLVIDTLLTDIVRAFPDVLITVRNVISVGNVAVAEFKLEGTQSADFLGAINQEKHLDLDTAWRFTVEAGAITGIDAYWCQNQLYRRLAIKRQDHVTIV